MEAIIQGRVQKIRDNLQNIKWLHCPGKINPADIPHRGLSLSNDSTLKSCLMAHSFYYVRKSSGHPKILFHIIVLI